MFHNGVSLAYKGIYHLPYRNTWLKPEPHPYPMSQPMMERFSLRIRSLAAEIRMKIFSECLVQARLPRLSVPALLAALRPDNLLYEEAVETFHKINIFEIKPHNHQSFLDLQHRHVLHIRSLIVYL
jgi:hypothetical protein